MNEGWFAPISRIRSMLAKSSRFESGCRMLKLGAVPCQPPGLGFPVLQMETAVEIFSRYVSLPWLPVYALLITGLSCAGGAFIHRFRTRGGWILVLLWLLFTMVLSRTIRMPWFLEGARDIAKTAMALQLLFGLLIGGILYLAGALGLRKARVN